MSEVFRPAGLLATDDSSVMITPRNAGWTYSGLEVFTLGAGEERVVATGTSEVAVLPLSGGCRVEVGGTTFGLDGRPSVFEAVTDFAYVPIDSEIRISSSGGGEFALCKAEATRRFEPAYVPASAVSKEVRGGGVVTRQINNFMSVEAFEADTLIAVEVITPAGNTSSYPPHKHDAASDVETELEEIYYFRIDGAHGFGLFKGYTTDGWMDETVTVRDGDVFLVPRGYHGPAYAPFGHHMYYLNVMAGPERRWMFTDDPCYGHLRSQIDALPPDPRLPLY